MYFFLFFFPFYCFCLIHTRFFSRLKFCIPQLTSPTLIALHTEQLFFAITFFQQSFVLPLFYMYMYAYSNYEIIFSICLVSILVCKHKYHSLNKKAQRAYGWIPLIIFSSFLLKFFFQVFLFEEIYD